MIEPSELATMIYQSLYNTHDAVPPDFAPEFNTADAFMLVIKLVEQGWNFAVTGGEKRYTAHFEKGPELNIRQGTTSAEAIFRAVVKTLKLEPTPKPEAKKEKSTPERVKTIGSSKAMAKKSIKGKVANTSK